jgi:hypothetical protein
MKKRLKHIVIAVIVAMIVILTLPLLIYVPPIQNWLVQEVAMIASEKTGYNITVEHVDLCFPLDLGVDGVMVTQEGDTIADIHRAVVGVGFMPLLAGNIEVDKLELQDSRINTLNLISDVQIKGGLGIFTLSPSKIQLADSHGKLGDALLSDADITVLLSDTAAVDTTESGPLPWLIDINKISILKSQFSIHMPGDSMLIAVGAEKMEAEGSRINLAEERYGVEKFAWQNGSFVFDMPYEPRIEPGMLDYFHINMSGINWNIDSLLYASPITKMNVRHAAMKDVCGLTVTELKGAVELDDKSIRLPGLTLQTPFTNIYARADMDFNVADSINPGKMDVTMDAQMGKQDIAWFYQDPMINKLPEWPLQVKGDVKGNLQHLVLDIQHLLWPTLLEANARGTIDNMMDTDHLKADVDMYAKSYNLQPLLASFGVPASDVRIPYGLTVDGNVNVDGARYTTSMMAFEGKGTAKLNAYFDANIMKYDAQANINGIDLSHFLPNLQFSSINSQVSIEGKGTDFLKPSTWLNADVNIAHLGYDKHNMDDIKLQAHLKNGHAMLDLMTCNALVDGTLNMDISISKEGKSNRILSTLSTQMSHIDLYALGITPDPLTIGLAGDFEVNSNLNDSHRLSGLIDHIYLRDSMRSYRPEKVGILMNLTADTTYLRAQSGSLIVKLDASGGYQPLLNQLSALADSAVSQFDRRIIDQPRLKEMLPTARLYMTSGRNNPMSDFLKSVANTDFKELLIDISTSPITGVNGEAHLFSLNADSTRIDTIYVTLKDKPNHGLTFQSRIANNRRNPQFVFTATIDGLLQEHGASLGVRFYDDKNKLALRLGSKVEMEHNGLRFHLLPSQPTIGYRVFTLNDDNFLFLQDNLRLQAKVSLLADDGTGVRVYSEDQDSTLLQDLTISLNRFDLDKLTAAIPYMPHITGLLDGDYHLMMDEKKQISVASDMQVRNMSYEGCNMGNLSTEFVYMQREDETHAVEGMLAQNGREVATFSGNYKNKKVTGGDEHIDGTLTLMRAPLNLLNGFIPDQLIGFEGFAEGEMNVEGSLGQPNVNGEIYVDQAFLISQPYGIRLRFDNDPVRIQQSKLLLENFTMYAYNDNPLNIMGNIDFHDLDNMTMDLRMRATNYQLINSQQTAKSIAYGKGFVNFYASMSGPVDRLRMRGRLDVLGTTDLTYLLLDSPLSTDNQLDELVKFTDFNDTTQTIVRRPTPGGLDMDLSINIDPGTHVKCGLNADLSNYVDLFGGGELRMAYNTDELRLTGRYTMTSGQMKYSLPVIPLKTFTIQDGSYVEFKGDAMDPTLNITATEHTNASVGQEGEQTRSVAFNCGVAITGTLNKMGLEFIIEAPEDYSINSELSAMSTEQRSKLAVTMLTTGMYLADGNTSGFSMNSALSSFLESEINNITGNALKSIDLSVGLNNSTDATGKTHTDYSFKFAKRFWNNRLKVQIGGKVSSGNDATQQNGQNQSFFDNVTMEYRLSPTSNQYVKLFYDQNSYDWLEGYTSKYGGGYIWKKKLQKLSELIKPTPITTPVPRSSSRLRNDTIR